MRYILLNELENTSFTSCKIQGLPPNEWLTLEKEFSNLNLAHTTQQSFYEVDTPGIRVLNILASDQFMYRITSQSMTVEKTNIGGRTIQIQKTVWTLCKE